MKTIQVISAATLSLLLGAPAVSFAQSRYQDRYDGGQVQRDSRPGGDRTGSSPGDSGYRGRGSRSGVGERQGSSAPERGGGSYSGRRGGGVQSAPADSGSGAGEVRSRGGVQGQRGGYRGSDNPVVGGRGGYDRGDSGRTGGDRGAYGGRRYDGGNSGRQSSGRSDGSWRDRSGQDGIRGGGVRSGQERGDYNRGNYDRGSNDRGTYSRGDFGRGDGVRGGYDRQRSDDRSYSRRSDNRDFGRYGGGGFSNGGRLDRNSWSRYRARSFASERRSWRQRGGYRGYRIPDVYFSRYFGRSHWFRPGQLHFISYGGVPCFEYDDYRFTMLDPYPEYWGDDWYDTDDCYVDYVDDGYYLYNRRYPDRPGVAINIDLRF